MRTDVEQAFDSPKYRWQEIPRISDAKSSWTELLISDVIVIEDEVQIDDVASWKETEEWISKQEVAEMPYNNEKGNQQLYKVHLNTRWVI